MNETLEAWIDHANTHKRSALIGVSLGGPENVLVYNSIDEMSDDDFEDVVGMLFVLFSGSSKRNVVDRLEMMEAAYRHARLMVTLESMEAAGEA
jgi:hypothetical protein